MQYYPPNNRILSPLGLSQNISPKQSLLLPQANNLYGGDGSLAASSDFPPPSFLPFAKGNNGNGFVPTSPAHNSNMELST
jgi:hypothetical protein